MSAIDWPLVNRVVREVAPNALESAGLPEAAGMLRHLPPLDAPFDRVWAEILAHNIAGWVEHKRGKEHLAYWVAWWVHHLFLAIAGASKHTPTQCIDAIGANATAIEAASQRGGGA